MRDADFFKSEAYGAKWGWILVCEENGELMQKSPRQAHHEPEVRDIMRKRGFVPGFFQIPVPQIDIKA